LDEDSLHEIIFQTKNNKKAWSACVQLLAQAWHQTDDSEKIESLDSKTLLTMQKGCEALFCFAAHWYYTGKI